MCSGAVGQSEHRCNQGSQSAQVCVLCARWDIFGRNVKVCPSSSNEVKMISHPGYLWQGSPVLCSGPDFAWCYAGEHQLN